MRLLRNSGLFVVLGALWLVCVAPAASAGDIETSNTVVAGGERIFTVPMGLWTTITGLFVPIIVGILVKISAPNIVKIIINALISSITGLIGTAVVASGVAVLSSTSIMLAITTFVISIATYLGVWRPINAPQKLAPGKGIG